MPPERRSTISFLRRSPWCVSLPLTTGIDRAHRRTLPTLALGLFGGVALGVIARAWMRLIAEHPEFTWNGTMFIVIGFAFFGVTQSIVAITRWRTKRRWVLMVARVIGALGLLPLFVAAGSVMMPTVVSGGFASAHRTWRPWIRWIFFIIASGPVLFVGHGLVGSFGWSLHTLAGLAMLLAVYGTIIRAARLTFAASVQIA